MRFEVEFDGSSGSSSLSLRVRESNLPEPFGLWFVGVFHQGFVRPLEVALPVTRDVSAVVCPCLWVEGFCLVVVVFPFFCFDFVPKYVRI